jgi:NADH dehydrogenase FAD-containing subunit
MGLSCAQKGSALPSPRLVILLDLVHCARKSRSDRLIPGTAPPAKQMGRYVGRLIAARVAGGPSPPPFRYRDLGDLATIGRGTAVVKRPDGCGSGQFSESALDTIYVARNRGRIDIVAF